MRRLSGDINNFVRRYGLGRGVEAAAVISASRSAIKDVVPSVLKDQIQVEAYNNGTLFLRAPSGSALATLNIYRPKIRQALKKRMQKAVVEKIVVRPTVVSTY